VDARRPVFLDKTLAALRRNHGHLV
jgi:hypothetical protein